MFQGKLSAGTQGKREAPQVAATWAKSHIPTCRMPTECSRLTDSLCLASRGQVRDRLLSDLRQWFVDSLFLPLCDSVFVLCFVVRYFVSILVLQSS